MNVIQPSATRLYFSGKPPGDSKKSHPAKATPDKPQDGAPAPANPLEAFLVDLAMKPVEDIADKLKIGLDAAQALKDEAQSGWPTFKTAGNAAKALEGQSTDALKLLLDKTNLDDGFKKVIGGLGKLFRKKPSPPAQKPPEAPDAPDKK